jgi:hypothetical protein
VTDFLPGVDPAELERWYTIWGMQALTQTAERITALARVTEGAQRAAARETDPTKRAYLDGLAEGMAILLGLLMQATASDRKALDAKVQAWAVENARGAGAAQ